MKRYTTLAVISFILLVTIWGVLYWKQQGENMGAQRVAQVYAVRVGSPELYPDSSQAYGVVNPNITQSNINQTICNKNWSTKSIRPPVSYTNALKVKLFNNGYHYSLDKSIKDSELDHYISLELGGDPRSEQNLWLESYLTTPNAKDKDRVENFLHKQVCAGKITLQEAQREITGDWVKVLKDNGL